MAIEARTVFLKTIESKLSDKLTIVQLTDVMKTISDTVTDYSMQENPHQFSGDNTVDDLWDAYFSAMKVQGRSEKTLWRYDYILKRMFKAFPGLNSRQITVYHLRKYLQMEKERGIKDVTLEGYREIFCAYFGWLRREGLIDIDPCTNLGIIKVPKRQKKAYSDIDLERIHQKTKNPRDQAIVHTLESTGCRISEVIGMDIADMDLERCEATVIGKGNKQRTVYIDEVTAMLIRNYLNSRTDSNPALFIGRYGDRLTPGGIREMLRKVARKAGVEGVYPHKFRRTLATNLNKRGMPVQEIAAILGHEKIDTTMKYINLDHQIIKASYHRYT